MSTDFLSIVKEHAARYPLMEPQDYVKLAYQSEFGPAHLINHLPQAERAILEEWEAVCEDWEAVSEDHFQALEPIGNHLCRFHLTAAYNPSEAALLLTKLFCRTAGERKGTINGLMTKLDQLRRLSIPHMVQWLEDYQNRKCPPVHHSEGFRMRYHPHYRLLKMEYGGYFPVLLAIQRIAESKKTAIIAVDGRCGSGKTGFSRLIADLFVCNIVHMDDFYLPVNLRDSDWMNIPGGNMDFTRFRDEVLLPARRGQTLLYRPFDCQTGEWKAPVELPARPLTIVEGSYVHHPLLAGQYDLKVFLTCSKEEQFFRLKAREGEHFPAFAQIWSPLEEGYFHHYNIEENSNLVVDTSNFFK